MVEELITRYPPFLQAYQEYNQISNGATPLLRIAYAEAQRVARDRYIDTASKYAIERWEKILHITPYGTDTLDIRRFRVKARKNERLPYTERFLGQQLASLCGPTGYSMTIEPAECTMHVKITVGNIRNFETVQDFLERTVPLNIDITLTQLYNKHGEIRNKGFTHGDLSAYTHKEIRESETLLQ
ncbi:putative phage tail protein [Methanolapillus millepedarum]|uniref:DUF2313 domain-containing protein n=1 Tax=Methanolapillus millepedarum TaxID=3028296 RepID=A0AA96ZWN2_9EURY|nr:hypothetical protein MsAc7_17550 [Methanosarcinaceae archaeon Ac7]